MTVVSDERKGDSMKKAIDVQVGDKIRDGVVLAKEPAWATSHGKPIGVCVRFTVRDETFPFTAEKPAVRWVGYLPDQQVVTAVQERL